MKNILIMLSILILYSNNTLSDYINIPDGNYYGNFPVGGSVFCNATIRKINVLNNSVTMYYDDIIGPQRYKFILNKNNYENKMFKVNNFSSPYKLYYNKKNESIKIILHTHCFGEGIFKLKKIITQNEKINVDISLKKIITLATQICKEIGTGNIEFMDKCVLTLIKNHKYFKN
tara:strand:+ start:622 stop:1143 length:522 start_codon:yes stop_codon:yes gene_type:complete